MMMVGGESGRSCGNPFTASQWQELELQALIFKYMASGIPVPYDLILPIRRSLLLDSTPSSPTLALLPHPPPGGWSCFQMGYGRKGDDPEPGRCRRTDGKKWRCSREAHPDSKYCERHMHRGKNRSRKLVELSLATNPSPSTTTSSSHVSPPCLRPPFSLSARESPYLLHPCSFPSTPPRFGFSPQISAAHSHLADRNHREFCGSKEASDEYRLLCEASVAERNGPWSWRRRPLRVNSMVEPEQSCDRKKSSASNLGFDSSQEAKRQHCFVLGADLNSGEAEKMGREAGPQKPMPFHCFIDERPEGSKESGLGSSGDRSKQASDLKTQLSISIPIADQDYYGQGD